jgi:hypothetical protein
LIRVVREALLEILGLDPFQSEPQYGLIRLRRQGQEFCERRDEGRQIVLDGIFPITSSEVHYQPAEQNPNSHRTKAEHGQPPDNSRTSAGQKAGQSPEQKPLLFSFSC